VDVIATQLSACDLEQHGLSAARQAVPRPAGVRFSFARYGGRPIARGLAADVRQRLSERGDLFVIAEHSSFQLPSTLGTAEIARRFGIRYVLSGDYKREGDTAVEILACGKAAQARLVNQQYTVKHADLPLSILIRSRSQELGLSLNELVRRCGYKNISKGLRRLDQVYAGDFEKAGTLLETLPEALNLPANTITEAIDATIRQIAAEADALYRASFRPAAYLLGSNNRHSQIFIFEHSGRLFVETRFLRAAGLKVPHDNWPGLLLPKKVVHAHYLTWAARQCAHVFGQAPIASARARGGEHTSSYSLWLVLLRLFNENPFFPAHARCADLIEYNRYKTNDIPGAPR
jgi:hypothetical protein